MSIDLLTAVDVGQEAVLILLDYSAAFDTINREKFFQLLSSKFGINGYALDWFKPTLQTERSQLSLMDMNQNLTLRWKVYLRAQSSGLYLSLYILHHLRPLLNLMGSAR